VTEVEEDVMATELETTIGEWAAAEERGDVSVLEGLLAADFLGIGPVGFVLGKEAWLARFSQGLQYDELSLDEVSTRRYGDTAVVVAHLHARGHHQNIPTPTDARASIIAVKAGGEGAWRIAGVHYSFIAGTPGAPG
jgi:ketosteroid isomerase-like protein